MTPPPWHDDDALARIFAAIGRAGGEARLVGGCVRDWLLDRSVSDLDIATTLEPTLTIEALASAGLKAVPTGLDHGTVTAVADGRGYEITTLRRDIETDGRRAVVGFTTDWTEDASRRDFTINALYAAIDGTVHDPLGTGHDDIDARLLRFVGEPEQRIREDYLRILRFFRFQSEIGLSALPEQALACGKLASGLARVSTERIWSETRRLLAGPFRTPVIGAMRTHGVLRFVLPEAVPDDRLKALPGGDAILALAALLPGEEAAPVANRLKLSKAETARLKAAVRPLPKNVADDPPRLRRLAYFDGADAAADRLALAAANSGNEADDLVAEIRRWVRPRLPVRGKDALDLGLPPGRAVGETVEAVEKWWVEHDFRPDRKACLAEMNRLIRSGENP